MRQLPRSKPRKLSMEQLQKASGKADSEIAAILTEIPFGLDWTDETKARASMDAIRKAVVRAWRHGFDTGLGDL